MFLLSIELNSRFIVMTTDEVTFKSTKSRHRLQRHLLILFLLFVVSIPLSH